MIVKRRRYEMNFKVYALHAYLFYRNEAIF